MQPKRILISVLVVILMFGAAVMSVAAAQSPFGLTVEASSSSAISNEPVILQAGDKLEVNIDVASNPGVAYLYFYLNYDAEALTLDTKEDGSIDYKVGDVFAADEIEVFVDNAGRTKCLIDALNSNKDNNKTGALITFTFTVNEDFHGTTEVTADINTNYITDINWNDIEVNATTAAKVAVHTYGEPVEVKANCTTGGTLTYTCTVCNEDLVLHTADATGHTEVIDAEKAPTCTETGLTEGKHCSVCNEVLVAQKEVAALGHKEETVAGKAATCTETGLTDGKKCTVCGVTTVEQKEIAALGHKEETVAGKAPTCTETGLTEGKHCSVCNEVLVAQKEVAALGHKEETVAGKAATCTETGLTDGKKCTVCGVTTVEQKEIAALGHTEVVDAAVDATCTAAGKTEGKHCSVCNEVLVAQTEVPAKGHTEVKDEAVEPTYSKEGKTEGSHCSVCNEILKAQEPIEKKSSLWIWLVVLAGVLVVGGVVVFIIKKKKN